MHEDKPTTGASLPRPSDQSFVFAATVVDVIDGDTVLVRAGEVESPVQVRFGWSNEAFPNLVNDAGLPASPFRTSGWQGGTGE